MSAGNTIEVGALRPSPFNTNRLSPEAEQKLDASLRRLSVFKPVVVREVVRPDGEIEMEIVGGEHRWHSAQRIGLSHVPFFNLGPISDDKAKEIMLADNARYGSDDAMALAVLLEGMDHVAELETFLPMDETDLKSIFAASNIALDALELDENTSAQADPAENRVETAPKTHSVMKFKIPIADAERITDFLTRIKVRQGFTGSDELTNAGDALVHALFAKMGEPDAE